MEMAETPKSEKGKQEKKHRCSLDEDEDWSQEECDQMSAWRLEKGSDEGPPEYHGSSDEDDLAKMFRRADPYDEMSQVAEYEDDHTMNSEDEKMAREDDEAEAHRTGLQSAERRKNGGEKEVEDDAIQSENEASGGRIHRERQILGEIENTLMAEVVNITSFDQNKEPLLESKAKVIFFQEHKVRRSERKTQRLKLKRKNGRCTLVHATKRAKLQKQV